VPQVNNDAGIAAKNGASSVDVALIEIFAVFKQESAPMGYVNQTNIYRVIN
jgi:hypothetical protein